jgi:tetratricopeptide (TPR) repeat protein
VPGWHEATKQLQQQGRVQVVGIIQEQHPDRCRLFMQWKQMGWPILVDSLNLLEVTAVPITLAVDEYGIIRQAKMPLSDAEKLPETFLNQSFEAPDGRSAQPVPRPAAPDLDRLKQAAGQGGAGALRDYANAVVMWGGPQRLGEAIAAYERALALEPGHGPTHFRLGVAYRSRYDSAQRAETDFAKAVGYWKSALDLDPNQYIWRRRIEQYGPRLDKPYSFYDWVRTAREEIQARAETPVELSVEPAGAEFAYPQESFATAESGKEPDPQGRIHRDDGFFVQVETTVVPPVVAPGETARVHLVFRPNEANKAHWNNEVDGLRLWVSLPQGWQADQHSWALDNPPSAVSQEVRRVEFEIRVPDSAIPGPVTVPVYGLYYVCEDVQGTCLYRRQDVPVAVPIRPGGD